MRRMRSAGLVLIAVLAGLLSGAAAGAEPTATALWGSATRSVPVQAAAAAVPQPVVSAPARVEPVAAKPVPAQPVAAQPVAAQPVAAPVVAPRPAAEPVAGTPCLSTAKACIKLSTNQSWLIKDGVIAYGPVPITHGRRGWATPPGTFKVTFKNRYHRSTIFNNAPMPYSVFFNGGIAFHEGSLTEPSHGCIHLSRAAAQTYFATLNPGDVVQVVR